MQNFILELVTGIKKLFRAKIDLVILLLVIILGFNVYSHEKLKKKIDHRYFNTTTTIEELFDINVNTYNGELKY